jgi:predicted nuclease with TOPRIM domain
MSAQKPMYRDAFDDPREESDHEASPMRSLRQDFQLQLEQERRNWARAQQVKQTMIERLEQELGHTAESVDAACVRQAAEVRALRDELRSCVEQKEGLARGLKEMQQVNREQREAVDAARAELERGVESWVAERQALQHRIASLEVMGI